MKSIAVQLQDARAALGSVAGAGAALEARMLAGYAWNMSMEALLRDADTVRDTAPYDALVARRMKREPIAHIVGGRDFWKDRFAVSSDVLTPRPDSETMIEALLRLRPDYAAAYRVLDLGTGSGCLILSALREYAYAEGVAVDQSEAALAMVAKNAVALGLNTRLHMLQSDWCSSIEGQFDIVLSNPPYIPSADIAALDADVREYEPLAALDGGADGLHCYRSILRQIAAHTKPGALLLFEVGQGQAENVAMIGQQNGFIHLETTTDLAGIARVVVFENL